MMLNLPLDFERMPEFWQLKETLRTAWMQRAAQSPAFDPADADAEIEDMAALLWIRLWIVLGYLARATNRPGWLNAAGERQLNHACGRKFGEDCSPVSLLTAGTVLRKIEVGYVCDLFATTNEKLAGNYMTKEEIGNRKSLIPRSKRVIAQEAKDQGQLLPKDFFRKRDGARMNAEEVDRSMVAIITLDRAVTPKRAPRFQSTYTQGLIADAWHVVSTTSEEDLADFYGWLCVVREHPATPKSAEEILRDFDRLLKTCKEMKRRG
jgi:hypothetical protein